MGYGLWVGSKGLRDRVRVKVRDGLVSVHHFRQWYTASVYQR